MKYYHVYKPVDTAIITQRAFFLSKYLVFIIILYTRATYYYYATTTGSLYFINIITIYKQEHNIVCDNDNGFSQANIMRHRTFQSAADGEI